MDIFAGMQTDDRSRHITPSDCFLLEELQAFQAFEAQVLVDVNYYFWLNNTDPDALPYRFLYCLELVFEGRGALLLSSGEDTTALRLISAESLIKTAKELQKLHGAVSIQRVSAVAFPLWQPAAGHALQAIRLSRNEEGLYLNDALVLDFGEQRILVHLSKQDGLELAQYG